MHSPNSHAHQVAVCTETWIQVHCWLCICELLLQPCHWLQHLYMSYVRVHVCVYVCTYLLTYFLLWWALFRGARKRRDLTSSRWQRMILFFLLLFSYSCPNLPPLCSPAPPRTHSQPPPCCPAFTCEVEGLWWQRDLPHWTEPELCLQDLGLRYVPPNTTSHSVTTQTFSHRYEWK